MPFSSFGLHPDILRGVKDLAFTNPTPIQALAIKPAIEGRDVLACASTGSGKTAAFILPTLHRLMTNKDKGGNSRAIRALVLTPTRELAAQILEHLQLLAVHTPITGALIIGGVSMGPQAHAFRAGTDVLIATPGRLLDHLRFPYAKLNALDVLILDEADRMLDMGFLPDIRRILRVLPTRRQTLFFSATMPPEVRQLMNDMLHDPVTIQSERQAAPAVGITQAVYPVSQHLKTNLLCKLLESQELESIICFTRTKQRANRLATTLTTRGISCIQIHGNRSQSQRTSALNGFKNGRYRVLVATDIAARGIDVANVTHVINFDCPHLAEDYIHRVGRTGRASALGDAFTFVSVEEQSNLRTIERALGKRLPRVILPDFNYNQKAPEQKSISSPKPPAPVPSVKGTQEPRSPKNSFPNKQAGQQFAGKSSGSPQNRHPKNSHGGGSQMPAGSGRGKFGRPRVKGKYKGPARPR